MTFVRLGLVMTLGLEEFSAQSDLSIREIINVRKPDSIYRES